MGQVGTKMRRAGPPDGYTAWGLAHWCPGCGEMHQFAVDGKNASGAQWKWDGNVEAPTFSPSMNIRTNTPDMKEHQPRACSSVCHYFLKAGQIQFLGDSTHALKGRTVPLPELPARLRDDRLLPPTAKQTAPIDKPPAPDVKRHEPAKPDGFRPEWWGN